MRTGFHVVAPAVSYDWAVDVHGTDGKRFDWGGGLFFRETWDGTANSGPVRAGVYDGIASSPTYAVLVDGRSARPGTRSRRSSSSNQGGVWIITHAPLLP